VYQAAEDAADRESMRDGPGVEHEADDRSKVGGETNGSSRVEYHFLSWRELYDRTLVTADRYSSGAAEYVFGWA